MKALNYILMVLVTITLTACGGGGGGGGGTTPPAGPGGGGGGGTIAGCTDSTATNYNSSATTDDGSCTYAGGGSPTAYAGFNLSTGSEVSNRQTSGMYTTAKGIANVFAIDTNASTLQSNNVDALVYQPTCIDSGDFATRTFNLVLVSSPGTASTNPTTATLQLELFNNTAKTSATSIGAVGANYTFNWTEPAMTSTTWSCSNGKFTISGVGVAYTNGSVVVLKMTNNDVYLGLSRSLGITSNPSSTNPMSTITWNESGGNKWEAGGTYASSVGEMHTPSTDAMMPANFRMNSNACVYSGGSGLTQLSIASDSGVFSSLGPVCLKIPTDTGTVTPISGKNILSQGTNLYQGTMATIGGKKVGIYAGDHASATGSDSYTILIEE